MVLFHPNIPECDKHSFLAHRALPLAAVALTFCACGTPELSPYGAACTPDAADCGPGYRCDGDALLCVTEADWQAANAGPDADDRPATADNDDGGPLCIDVDGDGFGHGCAAGPDCDETRGDRAQLLQGYLDADGDGYSMLTPLSLCTGGTLPSGYLAKPSQVADCDDGDPERFVVVDLYPDGDLDGFTLATPVEVCTGALVPEGYSVSPSPEVDCDDANPTTGSVLVDRSGLAGKSGC